MRLWRRKQNLRMSIQAIQKKRGELLLDRRTRNHQRLTTVYFIVMVILSVPVTINSVWMILERTR